MKLRSSYPEAITISFMFLQMFAKSSQDVQLLVMKHTDIRS